MTDRTDVEFSSPQLHYPNTVKDDLTNEYKFQQLIHREPCVGCGEETDECLTGEHDKIKDCETHNSNPSIWLPVGKKPSDLWIGESTSFNDVYLKLYDYFREHERYSFEYMGYDYNDALITKYGGMKLLRIGKWLSYFGLLGIERSHIEKEGTTKLLNTVKPTSEGWFVLEAGRVLKFDWTHLTNPDYIGVGKPYPSWEETEKWLESSYEVYRVPKYKQMKWHSEFVREYYSCLHLNREEMKKAMLLWLQNHVATIKRRGKPCLNAAKTQLVPDGLTQTTLFGQTTLM